MTNQTSRVLELLKRFNSGEQVCIEALQNDTLWCEKSEKTIRRDLDVIKEAFPDSYELIRGGEKGCYKAITRGVFDNFMTKDTLALLVQTFNISQRSNVFETLNIDINDKRIIKSKIVNHYSPTDDVLYWANRANYVSGPLGLHGATGKTISKYHQKLVTPENHRFASYAAVLKSFP